MSEKTLNEDDYRLCDKCGEPTFYEADLKYQDVEDKDLDSEKLNYTLDHLGDWVVLCDRCALHFHCVIIPNCPRCGKGPLKC